MFKEKTVFFWLCFCSLVGVFGDELTSESVSVTEGESVTLQTGVTELQRGDRIFWTFGANGNLLAKTNGDFSEISIRDDALDGRFRGRLKLDHQTGSLIITDIRTTDSGLYEVTISLSSRPKTTHRFNVTVTATTTEPTSTSHSTSRPTPGSSSHPPSVSSRPSAGSLHPPSVSSRPSAGSSRPTSGPSSDSHYLIVLISAAAAAGFLLLVASVGIFCICRKQRKTDQPAETREEDVTYANPTFYKRNAQKPEDEVIYASVVRR